jgi:Cu(I)/Ag(I) efflux system membrane protein CusA/SilA
MIDKFIRFFLENKLVVVLLTAGLILWGLMVAPFDWDLNGLPRDPVPVDAIPDIGENQQIVFTQWAGHSPQDIEDQITYPLTSALLGLPEVKTIRSYSMFGFSSIYIIFEESAEFYWSRSRITEKLNSLSGDLLPEGVSPKIGPDATALGQVFWYTLEGRDEAGKPTGGWDLDELRSAQDWYVRFALQGVDGVAEVASIGGFVKEYQIDVDPDALQAYKISLNDVFTSVKGSNLDIGAQTIEINRAEFVIRGVGFLKNLEDLRQTVITQRDGVPITLDRVAEIEYGPAMRRGALDKAGAEAVGSVVVTRFGENPLQVIQRVKDKVKAISPGLPKKVLEDGRTSQVEIIPFYDRTGLIHETLDTLENAVRHQILITIIVVLLMVLHLRSAAIISGILPLAVLFAFIGMRLFKVDANIVALSGIAIAIGTVVDMGIVLVENILRHLGMAREDESRLDVVHRACTEVGGAVLTAVLTTIVSFLPVFTMVAAEGKLFKPLAYTKTFALAGSVIVALIILPTLAQVLVAQRFRLPLALKKLTGKAGPFINRILIAALALAVALVLATDWSPLGQGRTIANIVFVLLVIALFVGSITLFIRAYPRILSAILRVKFLFLAAMVALLAFGTSIWINLGKEFMPDLDEGSYLLMPTTMPHASIGEVMDVMRKQDMAINAIPEVETVVGKLGRVDSPLDPAPVSMIETIITYKSEYAEDENGNLVRQWRDHIHSADDIWSEIVTAATIPGTTSAPKLQPIAARVVMLQSGMRAPMGLKVYGPDLETIEDFAMDIEAVLKTVPSVKAEAVLADRIVGKPYLEIHINREAIARYGIRIQTVQNVIEVAAGGKTITRTVEGRERYPVRVRYQRERRDSIEELEEMLVTSPDGTQIPLRELAAIKYKRGPQMIKSEDTFLVGYVIFDKRPGHAEVDVVEEAKSVILAQTESGELTIPEGVSYQFTGSYENQVRAEEKLRVILPVALGLIWMILYFQFKRIWTTFLVFSGILLAWAGGFILIWLYGQPWFMDINLFGQNLRELFQINTVNLSVAVWVGFLALFGIATDDGVIITTYLQQVFKTRNPDSVESIRAAVIEAGTRRVRPAMMTTATTILALLPVLTSTGRGSDVMVPMAIPTFGGMLLAILTIFVVPVMFCMVKEWKLRFGL